MKTTNRVLASLLRCWRPVVITAALSSVLLCGGCLIPERVQFQEMDNIPPAVVSDPFAEHPIDEIINLEVGGSLGDAGTNLLRLNVLFRDANLNQQLEYQVLVNGGVVGIGTVVPPSGRLERSVTIDIPHEHLRPVGRCYRIDIRASGEFIFSQGRLDPVDPNDLAQATWWVASRDADIRNVDMGTCP